MPKLVERVARAVAEADGETPEAWPQYSGIALAAIQATGVRDLVNALVDWLCANGSRTSHELAQRVDPVTMSLINRSMTVVARITGEGE